jgi:hypothetical protein
MLRSAAAPDATSRKRISPDANGRIQVKVAGRKRRPQAVTPRTAARKCAKNLSGFASLRFIDSCARNAALSLYVRIIKYEQTYRNA